MELSTLFPLPYYAVIFASRQTVDLAGYSEAASAMEELARRQPGFLGIDSARQEIGITVSYWRTLEDIRAWREHAAHAATRQQGRRQWYAQYTLRVAKVERDSEWVLA